MRLSPRKQGDLGELSAVSWLVSNGYAVYLSMGHSPNVDVIAEAEDDSLVRVQVKTSTCRVGNRWDVAVATRGGNRSWNGLVKRFSAARCDPLFVHVGDGRRWMIPAQAVEGGCHICLGGPKYAAFEVDPGEPLPSEDAP